MLRADSPLARGKNDDDDNDDDDINAPLDHQNKALLTEEEGHLA